MKRRPPGGGDYVPLRFTCERVEALSFTAGMAPAPYGLRAAAAIHQGTDGAWPSARSAYREGYGESKMTDRPAKMDAYAPAERLIRGFNPLPDPTGIRT
jgi:hypothetical protein